MSRQTTGRAALVANNLPSSKTISGATNATPIVVTTTAAHGLQTNEVISISGVGGNTAANGTFVVGTVTSTTAVLLQFPGGSNTTGSGAYTSGGTLRSLGFGVTVPVPQDATDPQGAATVNVALEALLDRVAYLLIHTGCDVKTFSGANGLTWYKPGWTSTNSTVEVICIGAGGGGGAGYRDNNNVSHTYSGGGGGGGGGLTKRTFLASAVSSSVTVNPGLAGGGGVTAVSDGNVGGNGTDGGSASFGSYVTAGGGAHGQGGQLGGSSAGGAGGVGDLAGGAGANGVNTGVVPTQPSASAGAAGGGAGGSLGGGGPTQTGGGNGGTVAGDPSVAASGGTTPGGGAAAGGAGANGSGSAITLGPGLGGAGGGQAGQVNFAGGNGGAGGGYGGGGGGGGSTYGGAAAGGGGNGGYGLVMVITRP